MRKNILVIFAKNTNEVFNRKSALGSYIYSLTDLLFKFGDYHFSINGNDFKQIHQSYISTSNSINGKGKNFFKNILSGYLKKILKDFLLYKRQNALEKSIQKSGSFDLIIEFYSYGSIVGYNLSKKLNVPLLLIYDAPIIDEYVFFNYTKPFFQRIIKNRERKTLSQASSIVVYSNPVKNYIYKISSLSSNIHLHQNVDFSRFEFINERKIKDKINIGFLGSFLKWHRVDILLEAFLRLKKIGRNVSLFLLGDGEEYAAIKSKVIACEYSDDIVLPGFVDNEVLLNYKEQIDIGVMPSSNWYGAPNKIFEYGASKMAVVAPKTPTIFDLFEDEKELLLFKNESVDDLFYSLLRLIHDKELRISLAENLQNKITEKYSKENTFMFYNDLIQNS